MITRIEIDGFKSFHDFSVDLQPFTVLIGANGTGKSNLFDAIMLLSRLAGGVTVAEALRGGGPSARRGAFSLCRNGDRVEKWRFGVGILVVGYRSLSNTVGGESTRLRYEVQIGRETQKGLDQYKVLSENLRDIPLQEDDWVSTYLGEIHSFRVVRPEIPRGHIEQRDFTTYLGGDILKVYAGPFDVTKLRRISREYPGFDGASPVSLTWREMHAWRALYLQPSALREPSYIDNPPTLEHDGAHLAALLWKLAQQDEQALANISVELSNAVDGLSKVLVEPLPPDKYEIRVATRSGHILSTRQFSDGTLRFIAYLALKYDREHRGVLCIEEPENGVHPRQLERIIRMLQSVATDFTSVEDTKRSLRQVIVSTHSTALMSLVPLDSLVFMRATAQGTQATHVIPKGEQQVLEAGSGQVFAMDTVRQLLDFESTTEQLTQLTEEPPKAALALDGAKHEFVP